MSVPNTFANQDGPIPLAELDENFELLDITYRVITAAGTVTVSATDKVIVLNKALPSATTINLPTVASRNGAPLVISDFAGNGGNITINPSGSEVIMGQSGGASWTVLSGGAGLGGSIVLYPVSGAGWIAHA